MSYLRLGAPASLAVVVAFGLLPLQAKDDSRAEQPSAVEEPLLPTAEAPASDRDAGDGSQLRLREGTRLKDASGRFRRDGDSLTFIDGSNREIGGLPNLNLERVMRMLKTVEEPESVTWIVSGVVTEFTGRNYLLISRAVYKSAAPPSPETLSVAPSPQGEASDAPAPP